MSPLISSETTLILQDLKSKSYPPQLAQEIVDEIIDVFSACGDRATIVPLTTVARAWRPRSQRHLFHTITLWISKQTSDKALRNIRTCSLDVVFSYVRVLRVRQPNSVGQLRASAWLLRLFTGVTELELRGWNFLPLTVNRVVRSLGHFGPTVRRLRIVEVTSGAKMLMHLVSLFPLADDIEVRLDPLSSDVNLGSAPSEDRPVARVFQGTFLMDRILGRHLEFLDFINTCPPSFHTLTIDYCGNYEQISSLINDCGDSLKTFQYSSADALDGIITGPTANFVSLSACTQLRTLSFRPFHNFARYDYCAWNLLFTVRSQHLAEINVVIERLHYFNLPGKWEWRDIDKQLCRLSDQRIEPTQPLRVLVHMSYHHRGHNMRRLKYYLKEIWPLFWEKGEVILTSGRWISSLEDWGPDWNIYGEDTPGHQERDAFEKRMD